MATKNKSEDSTFALLGLPEALVDGLSEAVKTAVKTEVTQLTQNVVNDLLKEVASEAAGAFLGALTKSLVKLLLRQQDKLSQITGKLDMLVRAPLLTGIRTATAALASPVTSDEERAFRERQLEFALGRLDDALPHMPTADSMSSPTFCVYLLQGLCYREVRGALPFARVALAKAGAVIYAELEVERHRVEFEKKLAEESRSSERFASSRSHTVPNIRLTGFTRGGMDPETQLEHHQQSYKDMAEKHKSAASLHDKQAASAQLRSDRLQALHEVVINGLASRAP